MIQATMQQPISFERKKTDWMKKPVVVETDSGLRVHLRGYASDPEISCTGCDKGNKAARKEMRQIKEACRNAGSNKLSDLNFFA